MSAGNSVYDLYRDNAVLWVEDELTLVVLTLLWGSSTIRVAVAGSKDGVLALVQGAPERLKGRVFGLVDRDFELSNYGRWGALKADERVYRTQCLECENYLLNFQVLAALSRSKKSAEEIEARARTMARTQLWWMAWRATLQAAQRDLIDCPPDPAIAPMASLASAENYILTSEAWTKVPTQWTRWKEPDFVRETLTSWRELYDAHLASPGWEQEFSGKELFRRLRGEPSLKLIDPQPNLSPGQLDLDLAHDVANKMRELELIPSSLVELQRHISTRYEAYAAQRRRGR